MNRLKSNTKVSNTGSSPGCVLSSLLFIVYTDSCRMSPEGQTLCEKVSDSRAPYRLLSRQKGVLSQIMFVPYLPSSYGVMIYSLTLRCQKLKQFIIDSKMLQLKASITWRRLWNVRHIWVWRNDSQLWSQIRCKQRNCCQALATKNSLHVETLTLITNLSLTLSSFLSIIHWVF